MQNTGQTFTFFIPGSFHHGPVRARTSTLWHGCPSERGRPLGEAPHSRGLLHRPLPAASKENGFEESYIGLGTSRPRRRTLASFEGTHQAAVAQEVDEQGRVAGGSVLGVPRHPQIHGRLAIKEDKDGKWVDGSNLWRTPETRNNIFKSIFRT